MKTHGHRSGSRARPLGAQTDEHPGPAAGRDGGQRRHGADSRGWRRRTGQPREPSLYLHVSTAASGPPSLQPNGKSDNQC